MVDVHAHCEMGERVVAVGIAAVLGDDDVGLEAFCDGRQDGVLNQVSSAEEALLVKWVFIVEVILQKCVTADKPRGRPIARHSQSSGSFAGHTTRNPFSVSCSTMSRVSIACTRKTRCFKFFSAAG